MASHTGPTRGALLLLCCMGTLLSVHTAPTPDGSDLKRIIIELKASSERLVKNCNWTSQLNSTSRLLRPFASDCRPPHYINSSAVLPYFRAIKHHPCLCSNKTDIDDIIQQLEKPLFPLGPETKVLMPSNSYECKRFTLVILQEFSTCVKSL